MTGQQKERLLPACRVAAALATFWWPTAVMAVHLTGRIVSVGFSSTDPHGQDHGLFHYKLGRWTPIRVDLTNHDGDLFSGWLEVRQPDRDGDVVVARQQIAIRDNRRVFLYVPAAWGARHVSFNVRVVSAEGSLIPLFNDSNEKILELAPEDQIIPVNPRTLVILDISEGGLNHLRNLTKETSSDRDLVVARCAPSQLPDLVAGLEMVDVIVWDGADPSATIMDLGQREALIEWVRRGGRLVLGVSKNWEIISRSAFGEMLPARLSEVTSTTSPQVFSKHACELLFGNPEPAISSLRSPLKLCPITRAMLLPDAESIIPFEKAEGSAENILAASRPCGRGQVVLVAAEMRELFQVGSYSEAFLRQVVRVRPAPTPRNSSQTGFGGFGPLRDLDLHALVEEATDFDIAASLYFLFAFLFVVTYIVVATFGSWTWLKKKGLTRMSWPAFAALSVAASTTSLLAVRFVRGIGNSVECFTVVDGKAGSPDVGAICYLGMKTATYSNLDLALPRNWLDIENSPPIHAAIRPRWYEELYPTGESVYAASSEYIAAPVAGQLHEVLFRATAKDFEGRWEGTMPGRLDAALYRDAGIWTELRGESWIENKLGTDLDTCWLFVAARGFSENETRDNRIYCYPFKVLPNGKRITVDSVLKGTERLFSSRATEWARLFGYKMDPYYYRGYDRQQEEKIDVRSDKFTSGMLLLTFFDEINQADEGFHRLDRSQGRVLDRSSELTRDTALFVGFANDAGPARLCWRRSGSNEKWRPIEPDHARTMYRFTIPIRGTRG
ncbi:MAG: hypothetical protein ACUVXJ_16265 [Phycisphaerae bacterium]